MAPEQVAADNVDSRSDIYAWGVVAWELLAHRHPFSTHTTRQAILAAQLTEEAPALQEAAREVPTPLATLVMRCLAKDPDRRPQTAAEILSIIDSVVTPAVVHADRPKPSRRIVAIVAGVAALAAAFVATQQFLRKPAETPAATNTAPSIAVLPLDNIAGDTAQEYFADGMTDELATALGRLPGLRVAARSAAYRYKGRRDLDVQTGRQRPGCEVPPVGSVRRTGQTIRLSAVLTESSTAIEIWSNSYTRPAADLLALQDSLTMAITTALADRLGPPGSVTPTASIKRGTTSREAYELWLKGNYYLNRRRPDSRARCGRSRRRSRRIRITHSRTRGWRMHWRCSPISA
jgi:serine/threonine-protein kinase